MEQAEQSAESDYMGQYTRHFVVERSRAAVVVVDMQYASGSRSDGLGKQLQLEGRAETGRARFDGIERMTPRLRRVLDAVRSADVPIVYVVTGSGDPEYRDVPLHMRSFVRATKNLLGSREHEILDDVRPKEGDFVVRKTSISAFTSSSIEATLRAIGRDQLLFTGISTNMCVDSTARDAADRGWECVLVSDCCSSASAVYHDAALQTFRRLFGRVATADEVLGELGVLERQPS